MIDREKYIVLYTFGNWTRTHESFIGSDTKVKIRKENIEKK